MYGKNHLQTAIALSSLAQLGYAARDFKIAVTSQEKSHNIYKKLLPEDSDVIKDSFKQLNHYL